MNIKLIKTALIGGIVFDALKIIASGGRIITYADILLKKQAGSATVNAVKMSLVSSCAEILVCVALVVVSSLAIRSMNGQGNAEGNIEYKGY